MRNLPLKTREGLCYPFPCFSSISGSLYILKCDGARPKCRACSAQASACVYAAPANLLAKRQKETIEELDNDKLALYEILFCLQTKSPEQATALLAFLRSDQGGDMGVILQRFSRYSQGSPNSTFHASEQCDIPLTSGMIDATSNLAHPVDARGLLQQNMAAAVPKRTHSATVHDLAGPLQWFFDCVGASFYIMDPEEVQRSIESIKHVQLPLGDMVAKNQDGRTRTIAAELAGMACIGVTHAQLANLDTAPPAELVGYFYTVAKIGLDAAIEYSPLRAVKICTLIAMYNIIVHATVALAYLGTYHMIQSQRILLTYSKILVSASRAGTGSMPPSGQPIFLLLSMMIRGERTRLWCICNGK
jgi:hypothetical protein